MDFKENEVEDLERIYEDVDAEPTQISYAVVKFITKNFVQVIGRGAFGTVYLGALRNGLVAVKRLSLSNDPTDSTQFLEEVKCLMKVNHKNIVRFLGYCEDTKGVVWEVGGKSRFVHVPYRLLCFEYVPNGSLDNYLQEKTHGWEWNTRYQIIKGICQGLHYLHELRISHLDIKPANVLLGAQMEPKITDFGVSRFIDGNQSKQYTSKWRGTVGYIAPEFIDQGEISLKSDIFSLGVIMKRLLTGSNDIIPENWHQLLNVDSPQMKRCIEIALICTDPDPSKRPTVSDIIRQLNETETLIQKVPDIFVNEPRHDPATRLYQDVKRFMALPAQTPGEYHRGAEELPLEGPKWMLAFQSPPKFPIITDKKIEDASGNPLEVILVNADTGGSSAPPKALEIELVPLLGNFPRYCWDAEDFQRGIMDAEDFPLLAGECRLTMWNGHATVRDLTFTDESRKCGCMFRIGVRVVPGTYHGARIVEAITEAFMVRGCDVDALQYNKQYKWQLAFRNQPRFPIYVGRKIKDVNGNPLEVILVDAETGLASAFQMELHIQVVLISEFAQRSCTTNCSGWSADEFWRNIVKPLEGEGPILSGDVSLIMKHDGRVTVRELQVTENSSVILDGMYRIGVRVVLGGYNVPGRIREGITKAFMVQDSRTKMSTKLFTLALFDDVYSLIGISWGGEFHERLTENRVRNVQDFLRMLAVKPDELRAIMGDGMEDDSRWNEITRHARTCVVPGDKVYAYSAAHITIYVNSIFDLVKVEFGGVEYPLHQLDETQKILVQQTVREAYEHRDNLQEVQQTWKLAFKSPPRLPIHTGSRIEDCTGKPLEIVLVDAKTGSPSALLMELHIQVVPLLGDFPPYDGKEDWSAQEFRAAIVNPRQANVPLLRSYYGRHTMWDGRVTMDELQFTDDSSWVRCRKFRIGACVVPGGTYDGSFRIVEAITEAFVVQDLNRKHYPPVLGDPVWRLEMIDKDGEFHRRLRSNSVDTVQEFFRMLNVKPDDLRAMAAGDSMTETDQGWTAMLASGSAHLNNGISYCISLLDALLHLDLTNFYRDLMWDMMISHAMDCDPGDKVYMYSGANGTIYVDSVFKLLFKIEINGEEYPLGLQLDMAQTKFMQQLILEAYEHRHNLQEVGTAMELCDHDTIEISWLLHCAKVYDDDNDCMYDDDDDNNDESTAEISMNANQEIKASDMPA